MCDYVLSGTLFSGPLLRTQPAKMEDPNESQSHTAVVARDTQAALENSTEYMIIGTGSTLSSGTFWKGLIDEVQICNGAVQP
jgi:hypothetical protein